MHFNYQNDKVLMYTFYKQSGLVQAFQKFY